MSVKPRAFSHRLGRSRRVCDIPGIKDGIACDSAGADSLLTLSFLHSLPVLLPVTMPMAEIIRDYKEGFSGQVELCSSYSCLYVHPHA